MPLNQDPKSNPEFNVEHQYQLYLQRVKLEERTMHPQQKIQVKQAFYGAWGQLLICMRDDIGRLDETKAIAVMEDMVDQVGQYWRKESDDYKARNQ